MPRLALAGLLALLLPALAGCGGGEDADRGTPTGTGAVTTPVTTSPDREGRAVLVAALGDSITAGSPRWDPDPAVRELIGDRLDRRSQWGYWLERREPGVRVRNCGVPGERTDEIAQRLEDCARGAEILIVQGGVNDLAQGRPAADAADDLRSMIRRGKELGLRVATVEVLPWNNGYPAAVPAIDDLNRRIRALARAEGVPVSPWYAALEDPRAPDRMRPQLTEDGDHPTAEGYRLLAQRVRLP